MGKKQSKVESYLLDSGSLMGGETFIIAAKAMPLGGFMKSARSTSYLMFGAVGAIASTISDKRAPEPAEAEAKLKNGAYVALTSMRVILLSVGAMSSSPKELVLSIDRSAIQGVEMGTTRVSLLKLPTLSLLFGDGDPLQFEFAKPDAKDAQALYEALQ